MSEQTTNLGELQERTNTADYHHIFNGNKATHSHHKVFEFPKHGDVLRVSSLAAVSRQTQ